MNFNSLPLMKKFALVTILLGILSCIIYGLSAIVIIAIAVVFMQIDKDYSTKLIEIYIMQFISIILILFFCFLFWLGLASRWQSENTSFMLIFGYGCVLIYSFFNYKMSEVFEEIAKKSNNYSLFEYSAKIMKFCAYTTPLLIGGIFVLGAQLLFFLGYATYPVTNELTKE